MDYSQLHWAPYTFYSLYTLRVILTQQSFNVLITHHFICPVFLVYSKLIWKNYSLYEVMNLKLCSSTFRSKPFNLKKTFKYSFIISDMMRIYFCFYSHNWITLFISIWDDIQTYSAIFNAYRLIIEYGC